MREPASSQGKFWELLVLNNALGMMWDDDAPTAPAESLCSDIKKVSEQMDAAGEIKKTNSDAVRQCLNNAGAYLLFREKAGILQIANR